MAIEIVRCSHQKWWFSVVILVCRKVRLSCWWFTVLQFLFIPSSQRVDGGIHRWIVSKSHRNYPIAVDKAIYVSGILLTEYSFGYSKLTLVPISRIPYVYIYIYTHTCICVCIHVYIYIYIHMYRYTIYIGIKYVNGVIC